MNTDKIKKTILNLSSVDYGGAGQFAIDFNNILIEEKYNSFLVVKDSQSKNSDVISFENNRFEKIFHKIKRKIKKTQIIEKYLNYDFYFYNKFEKYSVVSAQTILKLIPNKPDIIFIHWVTDFINAKIINDFAKLLPNVKIYILMLDNAPITGGCHYPWDCENYTSDCTNCPAILNSKIKNLAEKNLAFKLKYLPSNIKLIAFSETDYQRAKKSVLFKDKEIIKWIAYFDETKYIPTKKTDAKKFWNIPLNKKAVFFGASSIKEKRKGFSLLMDALNLINKDSVFLLVAGNTTISYDSTENIKMIGHLNEELLIKAYQAADFFVCPSIEDSGPMMINQSIMCGTPVIAFNTGVAVDLVQSNLTGFRVLNTKAEDLANGINILLKLEPKAYNDMSLKCRDLGLSLYSKNVFLKNLKSILE